MQEQIPKRLNLFPENLKNCEIIIIDSRKNINSYQLYYDALNIEDQSDSRAYPISRAPPIRGRVTSPLGKWARCA